MTGRPIIVDTDPGDDDAIAILLALASPELEIRGITAVAGNVPLALTAANARRICELAGRPDCRVFAGCARPILRPLMTAEITHGATGLGGVTLPDPAMPLQSQHGVDWIVDELMAAPDDGLTLCALGPLTNIAMAMIKEPRILPKIREIIMMGGAFFAGGNTTPVAEFNIYVDPHAAQVVFSSGCPLTLVPLDVTHRTLTTPARLDRLRAIGTPVSRAAADMLEFFGRYDMAKYGIEGGPLHDPCVVALLLRPDLFEGRRVHVEVELQSQTTLGMTVMDWWHVNGQQPNCTVISEIDADGFYDLITERLARL